MGHAGARKRFFHLPETLFGQLFCILFAGVILLQAANFHVVCSVQRLYVQQAEKSRAEHLVTCWHLFNGMTRDERTKVMAEMSEAGRPAMLQEIVEILPDKPDWPAADRLARQTALVRDSFGGRAGGTPETAARSLEGTGLFPVYLPVLETAIRLDDGSWLKVTQPFNVDDRQVVWSQRFFVLLGAVVLLALMGVLLLRVTRPMRRLGAAADSFGRFPELSDPLPEQGVRELKETIHSFNCMRERIVGSLAERSRMIAAMAHDLRTPLTKLQLRLDRVEPEALRSKLQETVQEIKAIISQGLEFARSLTTEEPAARLDLFSILQSLADDHADLGHNVCLKKDAQAAGETVIVEARPLCLARCLENLVSNACKYGSGAEIGMERREGGRMVAVTVADRGPGLPPDMLEKVFEPYFRVDSSRNRSLGGTGLGLTIARNMAALNGGSLHLRNREGGGLEACLLLPCAAGS